MSLKEETKTVYRIIEMLDSDSGEEESLGTYFETYDDAKKYMLTSLLPVLDENSDDEDYWKVTSINPDDLLEYGDEDDVVDERDNITGNFYLVNISVIGVSGIDGEERNEYMATHYFYIKEEKLPIK